MTVSEPVAVELLTSVSRLVRTTRSYAHLRNQEFGRTGLPLGILTRLHAPPCAQPTQPAMMRPSDLAIALGVSPSAVSRAVAGLVEAGFVVRTADPHDARACALALTDAGGAELQHLHHEQARAVAAALDGWDDAKAGVLAELLDDLCTGLSRPVPDHRPLPSTGLPPTLAPSDTPHSDTTHQTPTHQTPTTEKAFA